MGENEQIVISAEDDIFVHESLFYVCILFTSMRGASSISFTVCFTTYGYVREKRTKKRFGIWRVNGRWWRKKKYDLMGGVRACGSS